MIADGLMQSSMRHVCMVRKQPKVFAFDHCFWSMDESNIPKYAGQEVVFAPPGREYWKTPFKDTTPASLPTDRQVQL
ncbi:kinesin-like protein KIF13B isoform X2 [Cyprinus carpio]|uniref:Kinesin-like protein KIF13B isoform X2 n=1 Tax=Cyprinus carpio TaxID=7962 RepID=A0A9R0AGR6_CYPCA|nr:kinesin-like protein KIF13B isoform X2 [Cyprinus carpio]